MMPSFRDQFHVPTHTDGNPSVYLCGNSLGLQPKGVRAAIEQELSDWARFGVEGHFQAQNPWVSYHELFRSPLAHVVGALEHEVAAMGTLTNNLHLLMVSFYRPTPERFKIVIEGSAFPSDQYAVDSQVRFHGFDPANAVVELRPREGESTLRTEDIESYLESEGDSVALVLFGGVNYYSGQAFDIERITAAAQKAGAVAGWDLAHAAGNLLLKLHDWNVDFATWCTYKYMNAGPGAVSGIFVHERHEGADMPRFHGWWGHEPETRFKMTREFKPAHGADKWQLSNAPILNMVGLKVSLDIFMEATMPRLRERSVALTNALLENLPESSAYEVITPRDPAARGSQISFRVTQGRSLFDRLSASGVICDFREPDVIRIALAPLYNEFDDVEKFLSILRSL